MFNHRPPGYDCPLCTVLSGGEDFFSSQADIVRRTDQAMADNCSGISTRRHNEPDGYQDVWHHHVHVFPATKGTTCTPLDISPRRLHRPSGRRTGNVFGRTLRVS